MKNSKFILCFLFTWIISLGLIVFLMDGEMQTNMLVVLIEVLVVYGAYIIITSKKDKNKILSIFNKYFYQCEYEKVIEELSKINKRNLAYDNAISIDVCKVNAYLMLEKYEQAKVIVDLYRINYISLLKLGYYNILLALYEQNYEKAKSLNANFQNIKDSSIVLQKQIANELLNIYYNKPVNTNIIKQSTFPIIQRLLDKATKP